MATINGVEFVLGPGAEMPNEPIVKNDGKANRVILGERAQLGTLGRVKIEFKGNENEIRLAERASISRGHYTIHGEGQHIAFGRKTTVNGAYMLAIENTSITLGEDCMLSYDLEFRTSDAHSIIELGEDGSRRRVNPAKSISVGNHVWIGKSALLMPGVTLPNDVIVGARSLVTKPFAEEHCIIAGVPAKIISRKRSWDRAML